MEEKDYIEKLITDNADKLSDAEPPEGHFTRFAEKLKAEHKKKKLSLNMVLKVAAAIIFVLLVTNQAYIYFSPGSSRMIFNSQGNETATLSSVSKKYREVEYYYTSAINNELEQWNEMNSKGLISEDEQKLMDSELKEFEEQFRSIQKDLAGNPKDKRVINAMLEYYRAKLDVINLIVNKLEEVNKKDRNYETNI